jgi:membrane-associated phospholipid phosphatase
LNAILEWGLDVVRAVQTVQNPVLTALMAAVSFLGGEYGYFLLIPVIYWCVDERRGMRLGMAVLFSAWLNLSLKELWRQPRPYDLEPALGLAREKTFGLPSGHAQGSVVFWGVLGSWLRSPWGIAVAVLLPLLISFSRVYLGVHFPTDLFAGWLLGGAVLAGYFAFGTLIAAGLSALRRQIRLLILAGVVFAMNALHPQDVSLGGVLLGAGIGYLLMKERFPFSAGRASDGSAASLGNRSLRFAVGLAGALVLYVGLKAAFPGNASPSYALFRFLRYGLVGFWFAAGAPWVFLRLRLVGPRPADA